MLSNRKRIKFSKIIVSAVILLNTLFAIAVFIIYFKIGSEPETLIKYWFTCMGTELIGLVSLALFDKRQKKNIIDSENTDPNEDIKPNESEDDFIEN